MSEVLLKITGDSGGASRAVQETQERYERAAQRAAQITEDLKAQGDRVAQARLAVDQATTTAELRNAERRLDTQTKALQRLERAHETAQQRMQEGERRLTRTVEDESRKQGDARRRAISSAAGSFVGGLGGGPLGSAVGALAMGGGAAAPAAVAAAAAAAIRAGLDAWNEQISAARELALVLSTDVETASLWVAIAEQMGITTDSLATGFRSLGQAVQTQPEIFEALGISTKDAAGNARPLVDIFEEVRRVLSEAEGGTLRNQYAIALLGRSAMDLLPILDATDAQIAAYAKTARESGEVVDQQAVASQKRWELQTGILSTTLKNLGGVMGDSVVPAITEGLQIMGQGFDTFGIFVTKVLEMVIHQGARAAHALGALFRGDWEAAQQLGGAFASGFEDPSSLFAKAAAEAQRRAEVQRRRLGQMVGGSAPASDFLDPSVPPGGRKLPGFPKAPGAPKSGPAARDTVGDAIREHIDAIRDANEARLEQLRSSLEADQKQRTSTIGLVEEGRRAAAEAHQEKLAQIQEEQREADRSARNAVEALQDQLKAREKLRAATIDAIEAERAAQERAFAEREAQRETEAKALEDQLRAMDATDQATEDAKAIAEAQARIEELTQQDLTRIRSEALSEHTARVEEHDQELAVAREELARIHAEIAKREAREELQAKLEAIRERSEADRASVDDARAVTDARIDEVRRQSQADREATAERIEGINREREAAREATEARIADLQKEAKENDLLYSSAIERLKKMKEASKEAADAQIEDLRRIAAAAVDALEKQLRARQPGAGAGKTNAGGQVFLDQFGVSVSSQEYAAAMKAQAEGRQHSWSFLTLEAYKSKPEWRGFYGPEWAARAGVPSFAMGGSIRLDEDAIVVGMNSGRAMAIAHAGERASFTPAGSGAGGDIVVESPIYLDGRLVGRSVSRHQADSYSLRGGRRRRG